MVVFQLQILSEDFSFIWRVKNAPKIVLAAYLLKTFAMTFELLSNPGESVDDAFLLSMNEWEMNMVYSLLDPTFHQVPSNVPGETIDNIQAHFMIYIAQGLSVLGIWSNWKVISLLPGDSIDILFIHIVKFTFLEKLENVVIYGSNSKVYITIIDIRVFNWSSSEFSSAKSHLGHVHLSHLDVKCVNSKFRMKFTENFAKETCFFLCRNQENTMPSIG